MRWWALRRRNNPSPPKKKNSNILGLGHSFLNLLASSSDCRITRQSPMTDFLSAAHCGINKQKGGEGMLNKGQVIKLLGSQRSPLHNFWSFSSPNYHTKPIISLNARSQITNDWNSVRFTTVPALFCPTQSPFLSLSLSNRPPHLQKGLLIDVVDNLFQYYCQGKQTISVYFLRSGNTREMFEGCCNLTQPLQPFLSRSLHFQKTLHPFRISITPTVTHPPARSDKWKQTNERLSRPETCSLNISKKRNLRRPYSPLTCT